MDDVIKLAVELASLTAEDWLRRGEHVRNIEQGKAFWTQDESSSSMLAVTVMTVLMIAPIHLVVTRKDRHVEMISMGIFPVLPLYNRPM
jgi:hypothetical protein